MATLNLGLVKAIFVGTTPPTNTNVIWRDTSQNPAEMKYYNDDVGQWVTLDPGFETIVQGTPSASSGDESVTGLLAGKDIVRYARVWIEGYWADIGDGVKTGDCYFSPDGGLSARAIESIAVGDELIWNGATGPTELTGAELVKIYVL